MRSWLLALVFLTSCGDDSPSISEVCDFVCGCDTDPPEEGQPTCEETCPEEAAGLPDACLECIDGLDTCEEFDSDRCDEICDDSPGNTEGEIELACMRICECTDAGDASCLDTCRESSASASEDCILCAASGSFCDDLDSCGSCTEVMDDDPPMSLLP